MLIGHLSVRLLCLLALWTVEPSSPKPPAKMSPASPNSPILKQEQAAEGGEDTDPINSEEESLMASPTLGGWQFWSDRVVWRKWRIQHCALDGHYRLLDPRSHRHASGSEAHCKEKLLAIQEEVQAREAEAGTKPDPNPKPVVYLLHGIIRSRRSMDKLARHLNAAGFEAIPIGYSSTRRTIDCHADDLRSIIANTEGTQPIHLVAHSMGGLVIRRYFASKEPEAISPRIGRIVMLGTPNRGAEKANLWANNLLYQWVMGPAGQELVTGENGITSLLPPTLPVEVGIIAGGSPNGKGYSYVLEGDDDGTVTVDSTRLAGAHDFALVTARHTFIMDQPIVMEYVTRFLEDGQFRENGERSPIPSEPASTADAPSSDPQRKQDLSASSDSQNR